MNTSAAVVSGGMGGFLNPPQHPEHTMHVETDLNRSRNNRGSMSLSYAVECDYIDPAIRARVRCILSQWEAPPLESPAVQDWIRQVLGYFKGCYRNTKAPEGQQWNADKLVVNNLIDPLWISQESGRPFADDHAGVNLIRKFYPEFVPTVAHFATAYWGKKP
jgi:hypothetical protein